MRVCRRAGGVAGVVLAIGLCWIGVASAQPTGDSTPMTPPAAAPSTPATPPAGGYTLDTPIETIAADPQGKAILDKDMPGLTTHPMYEQFKSMSLKEVQPMSQGAITDQAMAKTQTDLAALKPQ